MLYYLNRMEDKNHSVISVEKKKYLKNTISFHDKNRQQIGKQSNKLQHSEGHLQQTYREHYSQ